MKQLKRLTFADKHCAFTDLTHFNGALFCCFREAQDHVSGDGILRVLCLTKDGQIHYQQRLTITGADLRDPKLCITNKNELMLLAYARYANAENKTTSTENLVWVSQTGDSWSSPSSLGLNLWWLWRVRFNQSSVFPEGYGFAYNRRADRIDFYQGDPKRHLQRVKQGALSLDKHGLGYPNESDLIIEDDGKIIALIRRDADSFSAVLGESYPPYTTWHWRDLNEYIGGPVMYRLHAEKYIVAGRAWTGKQLITRLWLLNPITAELNVLATLPSAGDNSYPGISLVGNELYVSYYSSHIDNRSQIYLAHYEVSDSLIK